ncbi:MAG: hypothetical protein K9K81_11135 [Desulfobacteraceae bacterium]|nr:hypothetical protein [Desulfobacteraceae bacterium]
MNQKHLRNSRSFRAAEGGLPGRILTTICLAAAAVFFLAAGAAADVTLSVTPTSGTAPLTVTASFTADPLCNCDMYEIFWGDGNSTGNLFPPYGPETHTYTTAGTFTVELFCYGTSQGDPACEPQQTVTVSGGADTTPPSISITSPTTSPSYTTASTPITLGGTASDNVGVTQVTWANSQGGSGTASGTTSWTAAGISLQPGTNTFTLTARDAANNTGTDQLSVTYNPPAGAFDVAASPPSASVVPDQQNVLSFMYTATAPGGGSFTVTSDQGRFTLPGGELLETVSRVVSIQLTNGSGSAPESLSIPARVITAARKSGQNRIFYERTFSYAGESATIQVTLRMAPSSAGPFSLVRLALRFKADEGFQESFGPDVTIETGRATVPRNFQHLSAAADITYNGGGLLRAQWKVDGQVIGYVTRYLYRGVRAVSIESPPVPGLHTYDTGRHSVVFEVIDPEPGFEEPEVFYFVTASEAGQQEPPPPAEDGQMRFENLEIEKKPEQQGFFHWIRPGPKPAYAAEGTGAFTVSKGDVLSLKATLVNETGVAQHNIRVEFAVDGQVVDASFINVIQPGESQTIEGEYTAPDNRSHIVEIRARDAEAPASEPLASIEGELRAAGKKSPRDLPGRDQETDTAARIHTPPLQMTGLTPGEWIIRTRRLQMTGLAPEDRVIRIDTLQMTGLNPQNRIIQTDTLKMTGLITE